MGDEHFEVVLTVTAKAETDGRTAFIIEVQQAALFLIQGLEQAALHRTLGTLCPATLFPYVREAVDSLAVRGGFPPLNLAPMNFEAAYEEALKQSQARPGHSLTAAEADLPPGLVSGDGDGVGEIQAAGRRPHRQAQDLIRRQ